MISKEFEKQLKSYYRKLDGRQRVLDDWKSKMENKCNALIEGFDLEINKIMLKKVYEYLKEKKYRFGVQRVNGSIISINELGIMVCRRYQQRRWENLRWRDSEIRAFAPEGYPEVSGDVADMLHNITIKFGNATKFESIIKFRKDRKVISLWSSYMSLSDVNYLYLKQDGLKNSIRENIFKEELENDVVFRKVRNLMKKYENHFRNIERYVEQKKKELLIYLNEGGFERDLILKSIE